MTDDEKLALADVYERAAEYLERNGWWGHITNPNSSKAKDAACIAVAINNINPALCAMACEFIHNTLELEGDNETVAVFRWNDDRNRTKDEVINLLHGLSNKLR